ncbi:AAA family ATPase [Pelagibius marinus]|uniref:AAA family ATPase n=1 Tax=Pelagibius marinus TaxID=2762760 RepID=UPI001872F295|nr:AAA family ATPase [Pelagibius marinus]
MGENLNVVGMLRTPQLRSALAEVCTDMNGTKFDLRIAPLELSAADASLPGSDLIIVEIDTRSADDVERLRTLVEQLSPGTPVVATAAEATLDDVRKLMRLGLVDVLPQPVQRDDVLAALEHASRVRKAARRPQAAKGRLVSVLKGGGGVGATTVAVQAGCCLAQTLQKRGQEVCILDFDVQGGTVALYLDLKDRTGLADLVSAQDRLDGELLRGAMTRHPSGLNVVAAPPDVMPLDTFSADFVRRLLDIVRQEFAVVIVDLPPTWCLWSFDILRQSDDVLLVTQMTVPGVRQARRQLDTLGAEGLDELPVRVVLNRYEKRWGEAVGLKEVEKALEHKIDFTVANDYRTVSEALNQGLSIADVRRRSKAFKNISKISDALAVAGSRKEERVEPHLANVPGR